MQLLILICFCLLSAETLPLNNDSRLLLKTADNIELYGGDSHLIMALVFAKDHLKACNESSQLTNQLLMRGALNADGGATATTTQPPPQPPSARCYPSFILLGKHCYYTNQRVQTWHSALKICRSVNSTLAYPENDEEVTNLGNYLNSTATGYWWIGGSDEAKEGEWVWAHSKARINYTNWAGVEPNNIDKNQHCLAIQFPSYQNYDNGCDWKHNFVCQQ